MIDPVSITTLVIAFMTLVGQIFSHMKTSSCRISDCIETNVENTDK